LTCDNFDVVDVRSLKLLHYYVALDADVIENDLFKALAAIHNMRSNPGKICISQICQD